MTLSIIQKNLPLAAINIFHMVIFEGMGLLLPIYLAEKGFGLENIGLVLAILPVIMISARTFFSLVADAVGNRVIFLAESISMPISVFIYSVANMPLLFSLGKVFEGIGHSAYWAVIRTESYSAAPKKEEKFGVYMQGFRSLGSFFGKFAAGAAALYFGFKNAFLLFLIFGIFLIIAAFQIRNSLKEGLNLKKMWKMLTARRNRNFWEVSIILSLATVINAAAVYFLYPLYLRQIGFDTLHIGALLAAYSLFAGITSIVSERKNFGVKKTAIGLVIFGVMPFLIITRIAIADIYPIMCLIAIGEGLSDSLFEKMIAAVTKNSKTVSTDIAVLHFPYRISEFLVLAVVGFFVQAYGFYIAFLGVALIMLIYSILASWFLTRLTLKSILVNN